jgi:hypothetical protein
VPSIRASATLVSPGRPRSREVSLTATVDKDLLLPGLGLSGVLYR